MERVDDGWQPIETAPTETDVLLWDGQEQFVGEYINEPYGLLHWRVAVKDGVNQFASDPQPTHWRYLPPPPASQPPADERG